MRRKTTTKQIRDVLSNNLLQVTKAECSYKSSSRIDEISKEAFKDNLDFLIESGAFANLVNWHYERSLSGGEYIVDCGAMNPYSETIITANLRVNDDVNAEDIDKALLFQED